MRSSKYIYAIVGLIILLPACITINLPAPTISGNTESPQQPEPEPSPDNGTSPQPRGPGNTMVVYHGSDDRVIKAVDMANKILDTSKNDFYDRIKKKKDFTYTGESTKDIANAIQSFKASVRVRLYEEKTLPLTPISQVNILILFF